MIHNNFLLHISRTLIICELKTNKKASLNYTFKNKLFQINNVWNFLLQYYKNKKISPDWTRVYYTQSRQNYTTPCLTITRLYYFLPILRGRGTVMHIARWFLEGE